MKEFTFAENGWSKRAAFVDKFGRAALCPKGMPCFLDIGVDGCPVWHYKEYCEFLEMCIKRNKPPTAKEYIDYFYLDADGVYRGCFGQKDTRDYKEFVKAYKKLEQDPFFSV